jgi:predicted ATPase
MYIISKDSKVSISKESLHDFISRQQAQPFYYYKYHDIHAGEGVVSVWNDEYEQSSHFERVQNVPTDSLGLVTLYKLLEESKNPPERTPIYKRRRQLMEFINRWYFYNANYMNLEQIRASEPKIGLSDIFLSPSGHNLALVIYNLVQKDINFEDSLNYAMKSILPNTRRVRPIIAGLNSLNLEWYFDNIHEPFYLNEMSDGTVRMLCWAAILLSPVLPSLLIIDEPELSIHTAWMPILAEWIKKASRRTQLVICTHSPDLLDNFTDSAENVLAFTLSDTEHNVCRRLALNTLEEKIAEGWKLGDLYRVGDPLIGGWPW